MQSNADAPHRPADGAARSRSALSAALRLLFFYFHKFYFRIIHARPRRPSARLTAAVIVMRASLAPQERVIFNADRPFVYIIRDNATGAALSIGRYARP